MVTLKKLASTGCTLIFTMYQSSTEVFGLFDRICLLSNGNTLFFGETLACLQVNFLVLSNLKKKVSFEKKSCCLAVEGIFMRITNNK